MAISNRIVKSGTLGFPRMGPNRELKFALEKFWRKRITEEELLEVAHQVEQSNWTKQLDADVDEIAVGMFSLYDHVLDWTFYLGLVPSRFSNLEVGLTQYFAMARGVDGVPALDMTKWYDSNYHYEVPELNDQSKVCPNFDSYISTVKRALNVLGKEKTVPVILGPLSYLSLSKLDNVSFDTLIDQLIPAYSDLLNQLANLDVQKVQVHEPSLVGAHAPTLKKYLTKVYGSTSSTGGLQHSKVAVNLVTYFDELDHEVYQWFSNESTIATISLDFTRGDNLSLLKKYGFPENKRLGAGIIDGRSIWKFDPSKVSSLLSELDTILNTAEGSSLIIQMSSSLQHVPYTTAAETSLAKNDSNYSALHQVLSFAYEKLEELSIIKKLANKGGDLPQSALDGAKQAWETYYTCNPPKKTVQERLSSISPKDFSREEKFDARRPQQLKNVPILPTTTIGSFPQTPAIRSLRRKLKNNEISITDYESHIDQQIAFNMGIQEALGLDILVHGEPERTDMVEFFGEKLNGFAFTENGWVQSYGSRCVRPPIIFADLERPTAMTVREYVVAQSFTTKPVKGMLTGPVTILNWSFPRKDITRKEQAFQIALCLRDEVADLEKVGCIIIQMDEPALREGMPLKPAKKEDYLTWAVDAFRLSTAIAKSPTAIHTHMCYCEFEDCMHSIDAIDADCNSIENARSGDETIRSFKKIGYARDLGPGTYDIHSPVVPPKDEIKNKLQSFLKLLPAKNVVVNPDCGLKTRRWPETIAALRNMVDATLELRENINNEN